MRSYLWVLCGLCALCATGHIVHAEEYDYSDEFDDSYIDDGFYDDFYDDAVVDDSVSSNDVPALPSLSEEHLAVLDRLGEYLEYGSDDDYDSISINDIEDEVFRDSMDVFTSMDSSLSALSDAVYYSDFTAFNGAISSTYLDLFRGFLPKLSYKDHYVLYRESQYVYSFVFGEDLSFSGSDFSGSNLTRVYFNAYNNGSFGHSSESSFRLSVGSAVIYSDLGDFYPSLSLDTGSQLIQIKWIILVTVLAAWMISLFKGTRRRGDRDKKYAAANTV